jgi:hypothetical protein
MVQPGPNQRQRLLGWIYAEPPESFSADSFISTDSTRRPGGFRVLKDGRSGVANEKLVLPESSADFAVPEFRSSG